MNNEPDIFIHRHRDKQTYIYIHTAMPADTYVDVKSSDPADNNNCRITTKGGNTIDANTTATTTIFDVRVTKTSKY